MSTIDTIKARRSIRAFTPEPLTDEQVRQILTAGSWAPSGLNNQPWRFAVVTEEKKRAALAELTRYRRIILGAPTLIIVFCDREAMYNDLKDHQAIGACIQNMLLTIHQLQLGGVWLGEILKNSTIVNELLAIDQRYELMAVLACGHPAEAGRSSRRRPLDELLIYNQ